jgi:hypothetical protein
LNSLKIYLSLGGSGRKTTSVVFDAVIEGRQALLLQCDATEIGLPLDTPQARGVGRGNGSFQIPPRILAELDSVVPRSGVPLWLSFPLPCGFLPGLPWESLLRARITIPPILRLSYCSVQPVTPRETRDIVLGFSFPRAKETYLTRPPEEILGYFFEDIPLNIAGCTNFHLFADSFLFPAATALRDRYRGTYKIELYDPAQAAKCERADSAPDSDIQSDPLESSWMRWIRNALGSRSVDIVHFICHGYLGKEDGMIALSESPVLEDDSGFARFAGVRQICALLDQVGAWSLAFSSPPGNYSTMGMRLLQDQVARTRPGPVLFHDMQADPDRAGLHEAYQFAYAVEEAQPPMSTAVSLSCHPEWAMPWAQGDATSRRLLNELTLASRLADVLEGAENTPSWLASGQRTLESSLSSLVSSYTDNPEQLLNSGAADALRFTARLLQKHAQALRTRTDEEIR